MRPISEIEADIVEAKKAEKAAWDSEAPNWEIAWAAANNHLLALCQERRAARAAQEVTP